MTISRTPGLRSSRSRPMRGEAAKRAAARWMSRRCPSATAGENCDAPRRQIESKSSSDSGDQTMRKLSLGISGVGASDQVLDVDLPPKSGVERLGSRIKLLANLGEVVNVTVKLLCDALLVQSGQKLRLRNDLVKRLRWHTKRLARQGRWVDSRNRPPPLLHRLHGRLGDMDARACLCSSMRLAFSPACRAASESWYIS